MGNCLVTKLKGSINNDELLKLGEIRVYTSPVASPNEYTQRVNVQGSEITDVFILKENGSYAGTFIDSSLSPLPGEAAYKTTNEYVFFISNGADFSIANKYHLQYFMVNSSSGDNVTVDINQLDYSVELILVDLQGSGVTGDLSSFIGKGKTALTSLSLKNTSVKGLLSDFSVCSALKTITITGSTDITGTVEGLANNNSLEEINTIGNTTIGGEMSALPKNFKTLRSQYQNYWSWSSPTARPTTSSIFSIYGYFTDSPVELGPDLDNCLQNLAICTMPSTSVTICLRGDASANTAAYAAALKRVISAVSGSTLIVNGTTY